MQEFKRYPYFLAQRNVLLGLIQVTTEETETLIKILVPNITLLKFGIPKSELPLFSLNSHICLTCLFIILIYDKEKKYRGDVEMNRVVLLLF